MEHSAEKDAHGIDSPGDVAWVSMMGRAPVIALYDGKFWRGVDALGPIKCVSNAVTSRVRVCVIPPEKT